MKNVRPAKSYPAEILQALVFYDGPQLVLLKSNKDFITLGFAIELDGFDYPILCAEVLKRYFNLYLAGRVDLRYVYNTTPKTRLYLADMGSGEASIQMRKVAPLGLDVGHLLPEHGIFSSVHTHSVSGEATPDDSRQKFLIDGIWEARDFSKFSGRMHDVYALRYVTQGLDERQGISPDSTFLSEAITQREWFGGGDYLSFYGGMRDTSISTHPLRVSGIEYHSPGYVELAGNRGILNDILQSIELTIRDHASIAKTYQSIRRIMRSEGLLTSGKEKNFSVDSLQDYVKKQVDLLCSQVDLPNSQGVLAACNGNVALYAKVVMSYARRVRGLAEFYIQGRVRNPD